MLARRQQVFSGSIEEKKNRALRAVRRDSRRRCHLGDESVSAPRNGLDVVRSRTVVAERVAQFSDGPAERRIGDGDITPHVVEQRLARQKFSRVPDEEEQEVHALRPQVDALCAPQ
jgi:hypothetical protein